METFSFNQENFNYWSIFEAIKTYYPIGISTKEENYDFYQSYPGLIALNNLIEENIYNRKNYNQRWGNFEKELKSYLHKPVSGTSNLNSPSFSANVQLEKRKNKNLIHYKELHFAVSLLGSFYTIYGLDSTIVLLKMDSIYPGESDPVGYFRSVNAITLSPTQEFKDIFLTVETKIRQRFPGYKHVPFSIKQKSIVGLQIDGLSQKNATISSALFHDFMPSENILYRGYASYGLEDWRI